MPCPNIMDTAQPDQPAIKINHFTRRSRLVLILTLVIAAFMRMNASYRVDTIGVNLAIIALLWVIVYRYFNFIAAMIAGLMFTLSPWAIWYTGSIVVYSLLLLPFAPTIYIFVEAKAWMRFFRVPLFIFILFLYLVFIRPHYYTNSTPNVNSLVYAINIMTGLGIENAMGSEQTSKLLANVPRPSEVWLLTLGSATLLGLPALWFKSRRIFAVVTLWISLPILVLALMPQAMRPDHFLPILPALCLLAGAGVAWLIKLMPGKPYSRMIILAAYGVVFLSQALWWRGVVRYLELTAR